MRAGEGTNHNLIKPPFQTKYEAGDPRKDTRVKFSVIFNEEELNYLIQAMEFLQQSKPSTAIKQMLFYGLFANVLPSQANTYLRDTLLKNERNNKRLGIPVSAEIDTNVRSKLSKR